MTGFQGCSMHDEPVGLKVICQQRITNCCWDHHLCKDTCGQRLADNLCPHQPGWNNNGFLIQLQKLQISPFACPDPESSNHLSFMEKKSYLQTDLTSSWHLRYLISLRWAGSRTVVTTHLSKSSFSEVLEALGSNSSSITAKPRHPNWTWVYDVGSI